MSTPRRAAGHYPGGGRLDSRDPTPNNARMARLRVTYWRDIPVLVTARDDDGEVTVPLDPRFQQLVDAVAMQTGLTGPDAYLADWRTGPEEERAGAAPAVAREIAAEREAAFPETRDRYAAPGGAFEPH